MDALTIVENCRSIMAICFFPAFENRADNRFLPSSTLIGYSPMDVSIDIACSRL